MSEEFEPFSLRGATLTLRFFLELALLAGIGVLAWLLDSPWRWIAVIVGPLAVATLWGVLLSPKAIIRLPDGVKIAIESILFLGTGAGLFLAGFTAVAVVGMLLWAAHRIILSYADNVRAGD